MWKIQVKKEEKSFITPTNHPKGNPSNINRREAKKEKKIGNKNVTKRVQNKQEKHLNILTSNGGGKLKATISTKSTTTTTTRTRKKAKRRRRRRNYN